METRNFENVEPMTNVMDEFLNLTPEQVKDELASGRSEMIQVCMNLTHDFNKGSVIRANNAFLGKEVILVGKRVFDRRGTVSTHLTEVLKHSYEFDEVYEYLKEMGYTLVAVDNQLDYNPQAVYDYDMPEKVAFIYGEEQAGLSDEVLSKCDAMVYIPQYGSIRSLNVAQAAAVMMSEYNRRYRRD